MDELLQNFEEPALTLEEALELIDTCDTVPSLDVTGTDAGDPSTGSDDAPTKPKKRVRNPQNDVKRRQRRKAERQQLKDQVQQYEALVELLKRDGRRKLGCVNGGGCVGSTALTARGAGASWLQNVVEEEQKLRKAEEVNAKLKSLLVGRLQAAGTIRDVLAKEKMLLAKKNSTAGLLVPRPVQSSFEAARATSLQLKMRVGSILNSTDAAFGSFASDNFDSLETISRVKQQDLTGGPCIELLTTTPLACGLQTAKRVLWEVITAKEWPSKTQYAFDLTAKESSLQSVELRFSMGFDDVEREGQLMLDGVSLLERRDEEHRSILAWTTTIARESHQLDFQSQGWIVVMKSPTDPQGASVVRTCCRISRGIDNSGPESRPPRKLQNSILRSMGQRVKSRVEGVQQSLVDRAGPACSGTLIFI